MARYFIQATHTPAQCMETLDVLVKQGSEKLRMWDFACAVGNHSNHVCYSIIEAPNENTARNDVPQNIRNQAQVTEVAKQTPEQVQEAHMAA